jgi:hypothetical protein
MNSGLKFPVDKSDHVKLEMIFNSLTKKLVYIICYILSSNNIFFI